MKITPSPSVLVFVIFLVILSNTSVVAQIPIHGLDVRHYVFSIALNDSNDVIKGKAEVTTGFTSKQNEIWLDMVNRNKEGKGMTVTSVIKNNEPLHFVQDSQHLVIKDTGIPGKENKYTISYEGIPADGLIISRTKFGERSFFADNWPNRAHNWIPCNDHLSDKATVEFKITAPDHYQVVANGKKLEEINLPGNQELTWWKEDVPLPTKVMAIGVTRFAVQNVGEVNCIPVSSWVYPQNKDSAFKQYAIAKNILQWYIRHIGPFPFEKLANVQSKTIFGGMENAGNIFYFENSVNDKNLESLFAHEIAHQWFGDNATEKDWPHLWLSEGFATYMTDLYMESRYGIDTLKDMLSKQRQQVIHFYKRYKEPVVDSIQKDNLMHLLNANSYQKGAWVLHIFRRKVGDSLFWKCIRTYYSSFKGRNATTYDLEKIFERVTHQNLRQFFKQWLYTAGQPDLNIEWKYNAGKKILQLKLEQRQKDVFEFPLQIKITGGKKDLISSIQIDKRITEKEIPLDFVPAELIPDPNINMLFTADVQKL